MFAAAIEILRVQQWYKNLIVFVALIFSAHLFLETSLINGFLAFISLCLLSSSNYILNDILDIDKDLFHDKKRLRPLPSGRLSIRMALVEFILIFALALLISRYISDNFFILSILLFILSQAYNFYFKEIPFADVAVLSTNFMLRALLGAIAISVFVSPWLVLGSYLLALFLALSKRKSDLLILGEKAILYKKVFSVYTIEILDKLSLLVLCLLLICYCMYSFLGSPIQFTYIVPTIPIIFFLLFRYYYLGMNSPDLVRNPESIFSDKQLLGGFILFILILFVGLYGMEVFQWLSLS